MSPLMRSSSFRARSPFGFAFPGLRHRLAIRADIIWLEAVMLRI